MRFRRTRSILDVKETLVVLYCQADRVGVRRRSVVDLLRLENLTRFYHVSLQFSASPSWSSENTTTKGAGDVSFGSGSVFRQT